MSFDYNLNINSYLIDYNIFNINFLFSKTLSYITINAYEMSIANNNNQVNLRKEYTLRKPSINLWISMLLIAHAAAATMIKTENKEQSENMQHIVTESNQIYLT
uniref:Uncharacterized protein n=1 Tax=Glossina palpalis gambiensis TaxID=67801 RepID=A0A1B0BQ59_9MUSC